MIYRIFRILNPFRCRLNIYPKFMNGRCMWCGVRNHGIHWKIKKPDYGGLSKHL